MLLEGTVTALESPPPISAEFSVQNLLTNFKNRSSGNGYKPRINSNGDAASYESCYKVNHDSIGNSSTRVTLTFDLSDSYFVHAVLKVDDIYNGTLPSDHNDTSQWIGNYDIHIGNDTEGKNNPKCPGGPFQTGDENSGNSGFVPYT